MIIFIRNKDGGGQKAVQCYSYEYHNDNKHQSTFTVEGRYTDIYESGIVVITHPQKGLRHASWITAVTPSLDGNSTEIASDSFLLIFDRDVKWPSDLEDTNLSNAINVIFSNNFGVNQPDEMYRYDWLSVSVSDTESFEKPEIDEVGYFNFREWLEKLEEDNRLYLNALPTNSGIELTDSIEQDSLKNVFITSSEYELTDESYSKNATSKITVDKAISVSKEGQVPDWVTVDYYLFDDGTYSDDPTAGNRVVGSWEHMTVQGKDWTEIDANVEKQLKDAFEKSKYEHKLGFFANNLVKRYGAPITVRMKDGKIIDTFITCVKHTPDDDRIFYECGKMKTKFTEIWRSQK